MKNKITQILDQIAKLTFKKGLLSSMFLGGLVIGLVVQIAMVYGTFDPMSATNKGLESVTTSGATPTKAPTDPSQLTLVPQFNGLLIYNGTTKKLAINNSGEIYTLGRIKTEITTIPGDNPPAAIAGKATNAVTDGIGVWGETQTSIGVYGLSGAPTTVNPTGHVGVYGKTPDAVGFGVKGENTSTTNGVGVGVLGFSTANVGVYGAAGNGTTAPTILSATGRIGVYGTSTDAAGYGVMGKTTATIGTGAGVYGESALATNYGVFGKNTITTGAGIGVYGTSASGAGYGIKGENSSTTATGAGILGTSISASGYGIQGKNTTATAGGVGVKGESTAPNGLGIGVQGTTASGAGVGVLGLSSLNAGVYGGIISPTWQLGKVGVYGYHTEAAGFGMRGVNTGGIGMYGLSGPTTTLNPTGKVGVYGTCTDAAGFGMKGYNTAKGGVGIYGDATYKDPTTTEPDIYKRDHGLGIGVKGVSLKGSGLYGETGNVDGVPQVTGTLFAKALLLPYVAIKGLVNDNPITGSIGVLGVSGNYGVQGNGWYGVVGNGTTWTDTAFVTTIGVYGKGGTGVRGEATTTDGSGAGVFAKGNGGITGAPAIKVEGRISSGGTPLILEGVPISFKGALKMELKSSSTFTAGPTSIACTTPAKDTLLSCMGETETPATQSLSAIVPNLTTKSCTVNAASPVKVKAHAICLIGE